MKIMFASDIHGSAYYCRKMLDIYSESGAGRLVILGDILYHGPRNDLPREYAPKEVIAMLNPLKNQIYAIRETATRKWTRWFWSFPYWLTMVFWYWKERLFTPHTDMYTTRITFRHCRTEISWYTVTPIY